MDKSDTKIIRFNDENDSVFTLKLGKSYNINKFDCKPIPWFGRFGSKKYGFKITNCVSNDTLILTYKKSNSRDNEYTTLLNTYLDFNKMN
jgi:hypothetical protein